MIEYENLGKSNQPFFEEYQQAFEKVLESGWYILGKVSDNLNRSSATTVMPAFCCGVANGLDALILSLKAFQFQRGTMK